MSAIRGVVKGYGVALAKGQQARFMGLEADPLFHKHREVVYHLSANEQDIMGSLYRDGPKKLLKKAKKNAPYFAIFLAFSALPVAMCEYIDHQNMLHHRY